MTTALRVERFTEPDPASEDVLHAFFEACRCSVAQQTPAWRDVIVALGVDTATYLGCWDGTRLVGVLPAYRFTGGLGSILTSVPQAGPLGGIAVCAEAQADRFYATLLRAYLDLARDTGCDLASLITSPFWPDREHYERVESPDFVLENSCLVLDLDEALDGAGNIVGGSTHLRRHLRKAEAGALRVDEEQTPGNLEQWYAIHAARHNEIGATPLPYDLFRGALDRMAPQGKARFFFVRRTDSDDMVAGGCYLCHGRVIDALMPAMRSDAASLAPNYLLAAHSMRWARGQGLRFYNWQASPPDGGVYRFKRQWGSREMPYAYLTWITGSASRFLESTVAEVGNGYPWHYTLPFDMIGRADGRTHGRSSRRAAWDARAGRTE